MMSVGSLTDKGVSALELAFDLQGPAAILKACKSVKFVLAGSALLLSWLPLLAAPKAYAQNADPQPAASEQSVSLPVLRGPKAGPEKQAERRSAKATRAKVDDGPRPGKVRHSSFSRGLLKTLNFVGFPIGDENLTLEKQSEQVVPPEVQEALGSQNNQVPEGAADPASHSQADP
ncbi:MAG TPA: hypothetical protein PL112_15095 [Candidatus Obscuribacter sp.]|nr:hypothetical protein [Candidatus Obscuribacter sp.]